VAKEAKRQEMRIPSALILALTLLHAPACAKPQGVEPGRARAQASDAAAYSGEQKADTKTTQARTPEARTPDLAAYFRRFPGTFVLYDLKNDRYLRHDAARAARRVPPYSTFKIPNSLVGLETGVIADADFLIKWDARKYPRYGSVEPFVHWWQDHTLRTAFRRSVLWYYQELATRVGAVRMKARVEGLGYGNRDTSGDLTRFWLSGGPLRISADEQVEFLKALYKEELPVSRRAQRVVKEIMLLEETPAYKLSGKTGGGPFGEGKSLGWFVGYLETEGNVYFFATQIEGPDFLAIRDERVRLTKEILKDLGHLR
jgi:beta-lactamase class D